MRENIGFFRGFAPDENGNTEITLNGENIKGSWVQGNLIIHKDEAYILSDKLFNGESTPSIRVIPETVGECTGLKDKNGKLIFEGDIVKVTSDVTGSPFSDSLTGKVVFEGGAFWLIPKDVCNTQGLYDECADYEIIGNIFENPELMGGGE